MRFRAAHDTLVPDASVGVEQWIPPEREKWTYTPGGAILSSRNARACPRESATGLVNPPSKW
jgi:hypothetical protein